MPGSSTTPATGSRVVVVGAGLAGLIAAAHAARAGATVTVLDGAGHAGGRAHTTRGDGFHVNLGPHAVFRRGALARELRRLGVDVPGRSPRLARARLRSHGALVDRAAVLRRAAVVLGSLCRRPEPGASVAAWLDEAGLRDDDRALVQALIRTATYTQAPHVQDATAAWQQLRLAMGGVSYVHGGWSTLVDGLVTVVTTAGGEVRRSAAVRRVHHDDRRVAGVELVDGSTLPTDGIVLAVGGPREAGRLLAGTAATALSDRADVPVRMATLDVTLDRPRSRQPGQVLGDGHDPRYLLAPSRVAHLAPGGGEVVHVARYLAPDETADRHTRADLESLFDEVQPGWRARVRTARFLPHMTVAHATPLAATGGLAGRAPVTTGVRGLAVAGDGFGATGQLADASAASAVAAVAAVLGDLGGDARGDGAGRPVGHARAGATG